MSLNYFTSESVTEGHPDKVCDQIADAILDAILIEDKNARVACETVVTTGLVLCMGEITTSAYVDIQKIARTVIKEIGYVDDNGFNADTCAVLTSIDEQSPDIAAGVNCAIESRNNASSDKFDLTGAGDQGIVYGMASDETKELMPLAISLSHKLAKKLAFVRKSGLIDYLKPDGKTQVTVAYENNIPVKIDSIIISSQHKPDISQDTIKKDIIKEVILPVIPENLIDDSTKIYINPTGSFVRGGPMGDSGLTGRKIIVDTYGGYCRHGGGSFSGKDPTKVDRSAAYMARYVAKNIVAAGLCKCCEIQIAYAIGVARPISVRVDSFGTGIVSDELLADAVNSIFDLRPAAIIEHLDLRRPIYRNLAAYGHFGRDELNLSFEKCDKVEQLKSFFSDL